MKCPACGSENVQFGTNTSGKGYSAGKGCCGYFLLGPLGFLCGACGSGVKTEEFWVCMKCGNKFTQKQFQAAEQRRMQAQSARLNAEQSTASTSANGNKVYSVLMNEAGPSVLETIKVIREITGYGLKEAKDAVETVPTVIKVCEDKEEAEHIRSRLEVIGAVVEITES